MSVVSCRSISFPWLVHFFCSSAVRVNDSKAYRKMGVTREHISRILELKEMLLSFQTGFNLVNVAVVCYHGEYIRCATLVRYVAKFPSKIS